jgi:uncharacterized protein (TIGR03435 family)
MDWSEMRMMRALRVLALSAVIAAPLVAQAPSFEVASVKPSAENPGNPLLAMPRIMPPGNGRFTAQNLPLRLLIRIAYGVEDFQITGGPSWQLSKKFDIQAVAPSGFTGGMPQMLPLLKSLLAERFALKTHIEQRDMPIYALVVARSDGKLGPQMAVSTSNCPSLEEQEKAQAELLAKSGPQGLMEMMRNGAPCSMLPKMPTGGNVTNVGLRGNGQPMLQLIRLLTQTTGRIVKDRTGLAGQYDWELTFDPQVLMALLPQLGLSAPMPNLPPSDSPALLTAIQEQLGLKLVSERGPVDMLVIDSAELPTPD